ncbi:ABC transporter permease [Carboxydochorda subterranea]|uniref:ABC transporter permease n=1 Tax=Carboxydichorda subterranea TaxID=3109565 RepID=A0ABZ1BTZ4_9FIRM|nr:ABC transporter permease [Limnochorda sp. L945t]WRP16271.1 ABC transporter permease [Limnochorda sp. L945t]
MALQSAAELEPAAGPGRRAAGGTLRLLLRSPSGIAGLVGVTFFVLLSFLGPLAVPFDTRADVAAIYRPPSLQHPLGTDHQGRDILSQIVHGGRDLLYVAALAGLLSTFIAVTLGALSAYVGGWFDGLVVAVTDIVLTIPQFPLLAVLSGFVRLTSQTALAVIIGALSWPTLLRAVRSQVLSLKEREFVEAARALDLGTGRIVFGEVLPNMMGYIVINLIFAMTSAMYAQVGLIFLGLVPLSGHNWAVMINLAWVRGALFFRDSVWYILSPIAAIAGFQLSLVWLSRALEEIYNPRLSRGT